MRLHIQRSVLPPGTLGALIAVLLAGVGSACGDDRALAPSPQVPDAELYWALDLNHHAVLMSSANSLYDTLTLVATPRNYRGEPLKGLGQPTFSSPSPEQLLVSPEGKLTAVAPTSEPLPVVTTLWVGDLKHADTAYVIIVDNPAPPVLAEFSAHPLPGDSAKLPAQPGFSFVPIFRSVLSMRAMDASGSPLVGLPVHLRSSDPSILSIGAPYDGNGPISGDLYTQRPGTVQLYASTTAFGVAKADTVPYRIGWPVMTRVLVNETLVLTPATATTVGKGALVLFATNTPDDLAITFANADLPNIAAAATYGAWGFWGAGVEDAFCGIIDCTATGNIAPSATYLVGRVFPVAGTYEYRIPRYGATGRIIVQDEP